MHFTFLILYIKRPLRMFRFMQKPSSGVQNYIHSTFNVISALIVVQYLSVQVKVTFKKEFTTYLKTLIIKSLKIR
jgi:hypothetical protein